MICDYCKKDFKETDLVFPYETYCSDACLKTALEAKKTETRLDILEADVVLLKAGR